MRISALQMQPVSGDIARNLAMIEQGVKTAAAAGSALCVTPELAATGYGVGDRIGALAESRDGDIAAVLTRMAVRHRIAIVAGMPERDGRHVFNSALAALPGGRRLVYRKCHLFGAWEKSAFTPGDAVSPIFEIGGIRVGMLVCYDIEFAEWARTLMLKGAQVIAAPTALPRSEANHRVARSMIPTRALENNVAIAYAGLCGREGAFAYQGESVIVGPAGEDIARAGRRPALITGDIAFDTTLADPYPEDRRPELYGSLAQTDN